jgi:hypothetical protein
MVLVQIFFLSLYLNYRLAVDFKQLVSENIKEVFLLHYCVGLDIQRHSLVNKFTMRIHLWYLG